MPGMLRAGRVVYPTGVTAASWDARSVWDLYRNDRTGSQHTSAYSVPGVDSLPSGASLSTNVITITSAQTFSGWNCRGRAINIQSDDVTIRNCLFDSSAGVFTPMDIGQGAGVYTGVVIEYCDFDGGAVRNSVIAIRVRATHTVTVRYNRFVRMQADLIEVFGEDCLIHDNYFLGAGYSLGAHGDQVSIAEGTGHRVYRNLFDVGLNGVPLSPNFTSGVNNAIRIDSSTDRVCNDIEIYNNIEVGSNNPSTLHPFHPSGTLLDDVSVYDNLWELSTGGLWFHPSSTGVTVSTGNKELSSGNALSEMI
jgi:hypothetical protein